MHSGGREIPNLYQFKKRKFEKCLWVLIFYILRIHTVDFYQGNIKFPYATQYVCGILLIIHQHVHIPLEYLYKTERYENKEIEYTCNKYELSR